MNRRLRELFEQDQADRAGGRLHDGTRGDRWVLWPVDPATTDAERAEWDVPPLAEALRRAEELPPCQP